MLMLFPWKCQREYKRKYKYKYKARSDIQDWYRADTGQNFRNKMWMEGGIIRQTVHSHSAQA